MAYIHFRAKKILDLIDEPVIVVGLNEKYEPNKAVTEIMKKLADLRDDVEFMEALVEKENKRLCPNWDDYKKSLQGGKTS